MYCISTILVWSSVKYQALTTVCSISGAVVVLGPQIKVCLGPCKGLGRPWAQDRRYLKVWAVTQGTVFKPKSQEQDQVNKWPWWYTQVCPPNVPDETSPHDCMGVCMLFLIYISLTLGAMDVLFSRTMESAHWVHILKTSHTLLFGPVAHSHESH